MLSMAQHTIEAEPRAISVSPGPSVCVAGSLLLTPGLIQTYCLEFPVAHRTSGVQSCYHPALPCSPHCGPAPHRAEATLRSWSHPWGSCLPTGHPDSHLRPPGAPGQAHEAWQQGNPMKPPMAIEPLWSARKGRTQTCWLPACPLCPLRPWLPAPDGLPHLVSTDFKGRPAPLIGKHCHPGECGPFHYLAHIVLPKKLPTAPQTAQHFLQHTFWCYRPPDSIINEQVPRFTARYWRELMGLPQWPTHLSPAWPTLVATLASWFPLPTGSSSALAAAW